MPHNAITPMTESKQRDRGGAEQRAQSACLGGFFERNLQAADDLEGDILNGFPGKVVHVRGGDTKHGPRTDADERASLEQLGRDGPGDPLGDQVVQRPSGGSRPLRGGPTQNVRLEANDGPIDVREGEGFAGRRRAQERRHRRGRGRLSRRRRLRLGSDCGAAQERETEDEANPQPRGTAIPGSRAVRHAADSIRQ